MSGAPLAFVKKVGKGAAATSRAASRVPLAPMPAQPPGHACAKTSSSRPLAVLSA